MQVASLCSFPIGVVPFRGAQPMLTVVVKTTFTLQRDGVAALAKEQEPLSLDRPSALPATGTLAYATDFVPRKAYADVLLAGHAHADRPVSAIVARIAVDEFSKTFAAVAARPTNRIPLLGAYLRDRVGPGARETAVGPRDWAVMRPHTTEGALVSAEGPPSAPLPADFDFRVYNVAPPDQQLPALRPDATLVLDCLLAGAPRRAVRLPGIGPALFHLSEARAPEQVALWCDTLCIDTDRAICTLTWRAILEGVDARSRTSRLVLTMQAPAAPATWASVRSLLALAEPSRAIEAHDMIASSRRMPRPHAAAEGEQRTIALPQPDAAAGAQRDEVRPTPARPAGLWERTTDSPTDRAASGHATPFASPDRAHRPPNEADSFGAAMARPGSPEAVSDPEQRTIAAIAETFAARALPFAEAPAAGARIPEPSSRSAPRPRPIDAEQLTIAVSIDSAASDPLPFATQAEAAPRPDTPAISLLGHGDAAPSQPEAPVPPAPPPMASPAAPSGPPPAREPLPLETYAALRVRIWENPSRARELLERHGLDEAEWAATEQHYRGAIDREAAAGRSDLALELGRALTRARDAAAQEGARDLGLADYVRLRAEVEATKDSTAVLAASGLSPAEWQRVHRRWQQRAAADSNLGESLRSELARARRDLALRPATSPRRRK